MSFYTMQGTNTCTLIIFASRLSLIGVGGRGDVRGGEFTAPLKSILVNWMLLSHGQVGYFKKSIDPAYYAVIELQHQH